MAIDPTEVWVVDGVTWHWVQRNGTWHAEPVKPSTLLGALLPAVAFGLGLYLFAKSK